MAYLVVDHTNYGDGIYPVGTFRSLKTACKVRDELNDKVGTAKGDSFKVIELQPLDKYDVDSLTDSLVEEFTKDD